MRMEGRVGTPTGPHVQRRGVRGAGCGVRGAAARMGRARMGPGHAHGRRLPVVWWQHAAAIVALIGALVRSRADATREGGRDAYGGGHGACTRVGGTAYAW